VSTITDHPLPQDPTVAGYCTSEQMDLWRQVFAEAARQTTQNPTTNPLN
jgi:hypothetical protein